MLTRTTLAAALSAALIALPLASHAELDKSTTEAVESYFEFIDYNAGTFTPEQISAADYEKFYVLDVRDAAQFAKEHIPGAVNIEWRKVFADRAKLPRDKTILAYCNTGSFSGQVAMALRMDGFGNVRILHGGFENWKVRGQMEPTAGTSSGK